MILSVAADNFNTACRGGSTLVSRADVTYRYGVRLTEPDADANLTRRRSPSAPGSKRAVGRHHSLLKINLAFGVVGGWSVRNRLAILLHSRLAPIGFGVRGASLIVLPLLSVPQGALVLVAMLLLSVGSNGRQRYRAREQCLADSATVATV